MNLSKMNRATPVMNLFSQIGQNGGLENGICLSNGSAAGASRVLSASPKLQLEDEVDDWTDENTAENRQRLCNPVKNGQINRFKFENPFPQSTNEDGSLPSSPDSPSDCMELGEFTLRYNRLDRETRELIGQFCRIYTGLNASGRSKSRALSTLIRVVKDVLEKHQIAYNGMVQRLELDHKGDDMSFVAEVAGNLFSDGTTNWGRIVSLVAFGGMVSKRLKDSGREGCVDMVSEQIASYLLTNKKDWLYNNKGWDGFVEFFHVEDPECAVRNALMALASVAGLGAGLAFLMR